MKHDRVGSGKRKPINLSLDETVVIEGEDLVLVVQLATTIRADALRRLGHRRDHDTRVIGAIDVPIGAG